MTAQSLSGNLRNMGIDSSISDIRRRIERGEYLTLDDGLSLYESTDIHTLGELANGVRERLHGRRAYYNVNLHINYTNYCVLRCRFCSFYRAYPKAIVPSRGLKPAAQDVGRAVPAGDHRQANRRAGPALQVPGNRMEAEERAHTIEHDGGHAVEHNDGYELSIDEIVTRSRAAYARGATEVHIVGGLHPTLPFSYYTDLCAGIRKACPHMHIKAFTAIEIIHFTRIAKPRLSIEEVLIRLHTAGLGSLPGGGAEIFDERVHEETFKTKVGEAEWFDVHRAAHELGIFTNATMLYGHVETPAERIRHLIKLREHQQESLASRKASFNCVIPLSFVPKDSALAHLPGPSGLDDLKTLALSRLMCPNIPHIKAFWIMQTPKLAQVSLNWGVDDIDGTVVYYDITKRGEGTTTHQELTVDTLKRMIFEANCRPVERDTLYREVERDAKSWRIPGELWSVSYNVA